MRGSDSSLPPTVPRTVVTGRKGSCVKPQAWSREACPLPAPRPHPATPPLHTLHPLVLGQAQGDQAFTCSPSPEGPVLPSRKGLQGKAGRVALLARAAPKTCPSVSLGNSSFLKAPHLTPRHCPNLRSCPAPPLTHLLSTRPCHCSGPPASDLVLHPRALVPPGTPSWGFPTDCGVHCQLPPLGHFLHHTCHGP